MFISHRDLLLFFEWEIILSSLSKIFTIDHKIFLSLALKMFSPYLRNGFVVDYVFCFLRVLENITCN